MESLRGGTRRLPLGRGAGWIPPAAILLLLTALFFSAPLARLGRSYYSSADLSQGSYLTRVEAGARVSNPMLSDPAVQMQPWLMFNRDALAEGHLPLWNGWNAAGMPHLANYQSAVLSPFSLPFYVLGFRSALVASAFLKLAGLALFSYLFFRAIELGRIAALVGAVAFAFSGVNVLLLAYPHSAVAIVLPASLYFAERAIRARVQWLWPDARSPSAGRGTGWVLGLCLSLACGLLAGHPEPFCFAVLLLGAYVLARLARVWWTHRGEPRAAVRVSALALELAGAGALAAGIAAAQLLPFFEYLDNSTMLVTRGEGQHGLEIANWPLWFFPDALGNPSTGHVLALDVPRPNYEEVNSAYAGGLVLWLALLCPFVVRTRRALFFCAVAVASIVYGHDVFGLWRLTGEIPLLSAVPMNRISLVGVFALSACAALCIDRWIGSAGIVRWRTIALAALAAVALAAGSLAGAERLLARSSAALSDAPLPAAFRAFVDRQHLWIGACFAAGALAVLGLARSRGTAPRRILGAAAIAAVFLGCGFVLKDYNPTIDDRFFFPRTPAIESVRKAVGDSRLMALGSRAAVLPHVNMPYGLRLASAYDALWVRRFDGLYRALFRSNDNLRHVESASPAGLVLCGVEYVLVQGPWPGVGTDSWREESDPAVGASFDLSPARVLRQSFVATADRLQALQLRVMCPRGSERRVLRSTLEDLETGAVVGRSEIDLSGSDPFERAIPSTALSSRTLVVRFDPIPDSRGKRYRLELRAAGPHRRSPLLVRTLPPSASPDGMLEIDGAPAAGRLAFDCSYALDRLEPVLSAPPYALFRFKDSPTRYFCVDRAVLARTEDEELQLVLAPDFDPSRTVVLGAPAPDVADDADPRPAQPAQVVEDTHSRTRLRVERDRPGYVVLARSFYPGWKARVDGAEQPVLRADYGLSAVRVGAGRSEVELYYDPLSFAVGLWISGASLACLLAWAVLSGVRGGQRPPSSH